MNNVQTIWKSKAGKYVKVGHDIFPRIRNYFHVSATLWQEPKTKVWHSLKPGLTFKSNMREIKSVRLEVKNANRIEKRKAKREKAL